MCADTADTADIADTHDAVATTPATDPTTAAIHEQNVALLAEVAELEHELDVKRREVEKLGSRVTNLELDVQRRDAVIERLRAEKPGEPPGMMPEAHREDWWRAEVARAEAEKSEIRLQYEKRLLDAEERGHKLEDKIRDLQSAGSAAFAQLTPTCPLPHVMRQRLPDDRQGRTYKLRIGTKEDLCEACGAPLPGSRVSGHLTVNAYPDGRPGELFLALDRARRGDLAATMGHQLAIAISIALQHGVPLEVFTSRMRHVRDESGGTVMCDDGNGKLVPAENPRTVGSLVDLIAATLERHADGGQP